MNDRFIFGFCGNLFGNGGAASFSAQNYASPRVAQRTDVEARHSTHEVDGTCMKT